MAPMRRRLSSKPRPIPMPARMAHGLAQIGRAPEIRKRIETTRLVLVAPLSFRPGAADMRTDVEARPIVSRGHNRRRRLVDWLLQIGRHAALTQPNAQRGCCQQSQDSITHVPLRSRPAASSPIHPGHWIDQYLPSGAMLVWKLSPGQPRASEIHFFCD